MRFLILIFLLTSISVFSQEIRSDIGALPTSVSVSHNLRLRFDNDTTICVQSTIPFVVTFDKEYVYINEIKEDWNKFNFDIRTKEILVEEQQ